MATKYQHFVTMLSYLRTLGRSVSVSFCVFFFCEPLFSGRVVLTMDKTLNQVLLEAEEDVAGNFQDAFAGLQRPVQILVKQVA